MKKRGKRLWSTLLSLAVTATMIPIQPVAAEENSFKIITSLDFTDGKYSNADVTCEGAVAAGGSGHTHVDEEYCWEWTAADKTLSLNNIELEYAIASGVTENYAIIMPNGGIIRVAGDANSILISETDTSGGSLVTGNKYGIYSPGALEIVGTGTLSLTNSSIITGTGLAINADTVGGLKIESRNAYYDALHVIGSSTVLGDGISISRAICDISSKNSNIKGIYTGKETLKITNSSQVTIHGIKTGLDGGDVTIEDSVITATDISQYAFLANKAVINNSTVEATSGDVAIYGVTGSVEILNSDVHAVSQRSFAILSKIMIGITDSDIYAKGGYDGLISHPALQANASAANNSDELIKKIILNNVTEKSGGKLAVSDWISVNPGYQSRTTFIGQADTVVVDGNGVVTNGQNEVILRTPHTVTLNGTDSTAMGAGTYLFGDTVTIDAGSLSGYSFAGWSTSGVTLANSSSPVTTFIMPTKDVTITATWNAVGGYTPPPQKNGFKDDGKYYINGKPATGKQIIDGIVYIFDKNGNPESGWTKAEDGKWYYMTEKGCLQNRWLQDNNGKWYFLGKDSTMQTGWKSLDGKWYFLNNSGAMQTGWQLVNGSWYLLGDGGNMKTGWQLSDGKWYWMNGGGSMKADAWVFTKDKWYYVGTSGAMLANVTTPDGFRVGADGAWVK